MAVACGAALTMFGARRGGFIGGLLATAGTALGIRAMMGRRDMGDRPRLDRSAAEGQRLAAEGHRADASEESFPASDPPSWTPTILSRLARWRPHDLHRPRVSG